jgi:hypothetical protein
MMKCPLDWEIYRRQSPHVRGDMGDRYNGYLRIPARDMIIVFSNGGGWEHVSVSHPDRCPTWDEMSDIKRRFWETTDAVMQLHVPEEHHKNFHPYCLHLWRPLSLMIPLPPSVMVAP